jgi:hypothetical protein
MIMRWTVDGAAYRTRWQGMDFLLYEDQKTGRWRMKSSGPKGSQTVRQTWPNARGAMQQIDARQQKLIMEQAKEAMNGR